MSVSVLSSNRGVLCRVVLATALLTLAAAGPAAAQSSRARLSGVLTRLADEHANRGDAAALALAAQRGLKTRDADRVVVILQPRPGRPAAAIDRSEIERRGGRLEAVSRSFARVSVPAGRLMELAAHRDVALVREPVRAVAHSGFGPRVSESVPLTGAAALQEQGLRGAGVKIAVIDLGFVNLSAAVLAGELPPYVGVDFTGTGLETETEHGTGVAEHAMDMAPDAQLYCIKVADEVDLENAADYLAVHGIRIANHSVGWVNSSYYDDTGPINGIVNQSHDVDGIFWSVAAGNDARQHWRAQWFDPDFDDSFDFTPGDERMELETPSASASIFLNWNQYGASITDLDLYVHNRFDIVVASSVDRQFGPQDPTEAVTFVYQGVEAPYRIEVRRFAGPTVGLDFTLFSFNNDLEHAVPAASLMDPPNAHGAFTVGAVAQADWPLPSPPVEPSSSQGPTTDGRTKPDIVAPDGTTSMTYGPAGAFGTSFSSPTVAGAAAVLLGADPGLTAPEIADRLRSLARDIGSPGVDHVFGAGQLKLPPPVQVVTTPPGLEVTVDAVIATSPMVFAWVPGSSHTLGTGSPQGAGDTRYVFSNWSDGGGQSHAITAPSAPVIYSAGFTTQHRLTIAVTPAGGGAVIPLPPAVDGFYDAGSPVQLTAGASGSYEFAGWTGDLAGANNPESVVMSAPRFVTAEFRAVTGIGDGPGPGPATFQLLRNAPNPLVRATTISYSIPRRDHVRLRIFDANGRLVRTPVEGETSSGPHSFDWDGTDDAGRRLPSGIYVMVLESGGLRQSRTMVVAR